MISNMLLYASCRDCMCVYLSVYDWQASATSFYVLGSISTDNYVEPVQMIV